MVFSKRIKYKFQSWEVQFDQICFVCYPCSFLLWLSLLVGATRLIVWLGSYAITCFIEYSPKVFSWSNISKPKFSNDLGLHKMQDINKAQLFKIGRLLSSWLDLFWVKVLRSNYFPHLPFFRCEKKGPDSPQWKIFLNFRPIYPKGFALELENGTLLIFGKTSRFPITQGSFLFLETQRQLIKLTWLIVLFCIMESGIKTFFWSFLMMVELTV